MLPNAMKMAATLSPLLTRYFFSSMVQRLMAYFVFQCFEAAETCVGSEKIDYTLSVSDGECVKVSDCSDTLASWSCDVRNTNLIATLTASVGGFYKTLTTNLSQFFFTLLLLLQYTMYTVFGVQIQTDNRFV